MIDTNDIVAALIEWKDLARRNGQITREDILDEVINLVKTCPECEADWESAQNLFICSRCRARHEVDSLYCPSCGARMRNASSWKYWFTDDDGNEICAVCEVVK